MHFKIVESCSSFIPILHVKIKSNTEYDVINRAFEQVLKLIKFQNLFGTRV